MQLHVEAERVPAPGPHPILREQVPPAADRPEAADATRARPSLLARLFRRPLFVALVLVPNLLSILYFGLIAAPIYTSRTSLLVLNPKQSGPSLSSLLAGASGDSSEQGGYILKDYFSSWDAFRKADRTLGLASAYGRGDPVSRFGGLLGLYRTTDVALWHYFQNRVGVEIDQKSGIVSLDVDAYDPRYATRLSRALLADAVAHMDAMNAEQERDYLASAIARKAGAEAALRGDLAALARYRDRTGTYDPKELYLSNLALMNSLALKQTDLKSQRDALAKSVPGNPQAQTLSDAMASVRGDISTTRNGFPAMARTSSEYEKLLVARDTDITLLGQANLALQEAQASAEKNRYYLNVIGHPSQPSTPEGPRGLLWIGGIALLSLALWGLLR